MVSAEIRLNADGAVLTVDEMRTFTTTADKYGVGGDTPVEVKVVNGAAVFSIPVVLTHRVLTNGRHNGKTPAMKPARRSKR